MAVIPNATAIVLMAVLLGKSKEYYKTKNTEGGYFRYFLWTVIGMAIFSILRDVGREFYHFHTADSAL